MIETKTFTLTRYAGNPILSPKADSDWECSVATNPAAWFNEETGQVELLYRAAGDDDLHTVHFGLATSEDGYNFTRVSDQPVLSPIPNTIDGGCVEDPRVIKIGEWYYVTVATRPFAPGKYWENEGNRAYTPPSLPAEFPAALRKNLTSTQLFLTKDFKDWIRAGRMTNAKYDERDVAIFPEKVDGKFVCLHRPMEWCGQGFENSHPGMWISFSDDLLEWKELKLLAKGEQSWEKKIGGNNPPLKTEAGWLTIYHGVGDDGHYRLGAMLLDLDDPSKVTHRTRDWIYQPEAEYETKGFYKGVCFPCGHVVKDGTYFLYYGGGDVHCAVATANLQEFIDYLLTQPV